MKRNLKYTNMKSIKSLLVALLLGASFLSYGQQGEVSSLRVGFKVDPSSVTVDPNNPRAYASAAFEVLFYIQITDTVNVNNVLVSLGSSDGASNYFSYSLALNGSNLPQGVSIEKQGDLWVIHTGIYSGINVYYGSAKLQYANGTYSAEKKVNNAQ
jgi:hypothetical protein